MWIALALSLPLAYAHDDPNAGHVAGNPDTTCEDTPSERADHDYGPPAAGLFIQGLQESNLEDCDGDFVPTNPFCYLEEVAREDLDGAGTNPNDPNDLVCERFDDDEHDEYTRGGAWLLVNTGDGVTGGTQLCFGRDGHHPNFGPVTVSDLVLGQTVPFTVEADLVDATGLADPCGDFQSDVSTSCVATCSVTYPAGLDGSYQVYVGFGTPGTQGHVCTPGGDCDFTPPCSNGIDDDGDGRTDFPEDPGCDSPVDPDESDAGLRDPLPDCLDLADNDDDNLENGNAGGVDWIDIVGILQGHNDSDRGCAGPLDESEEYDPNDGEPLTTILGECLDLADNDHDDGKDVVDIQGIFDGPQNPDAQCTTPLDPE